jgi:aspartate ammonia-lyase
VSENAAGRRYGFVGILVENRERVGTEVQSTLREFGTLIQGRMGLPHLENDRLSVITLIVRANPDEIGALTGKLGRIDGVTVKSGMAKL